MFFFLQICDEKMQFLQLIVVVALLAVASCAVPYGRHYGVPAYAAASPAYGYAPAHDYVS